MENNYCLHMVMRDDGKLDFYETFPNPHADGALTPRILGIFRDGKPVSVSVVSQGNVHLLVFKDESLLTTFQLCSKE